MLFPLTLGFTALTTSPSSDMPNLLPNVVLASRRCPEIAGRNRSGLEVYSAGKFSQRWAQVSTRSGSLNIRSAPNGRVIGRIPSGWQVIVGRYDTSKRWAYIYSKYGDTGYTYAFMSAPGFRRAGWVSVDYLVPLGQSCAKPLELSLLPNPQPIAAADVRTSLEDTILAWINPS
jgi:hypothetical protein